MPNNEPWTPARRVKKLLEERDELGRPLVFVQAPTSQWVHVIGPDEDQPGYTSVVDALATRRFRTVCGLAVRLLPPNGISGTFNDDRIHHLCLTAFNQVSADAGAAIFADNTEAVQNGAAAAIAMIQRDKHDELAATEVPRATE